MELRWLRDPNYVKNLIESYTRGGVEKLSGITYTHYIHRAILEFAQTVGDVPFLVSQLDGMIATYDLWNSTRDKTSGLYHRTPVLDAQEYSLPVRRTIIPQGRSRKLNRLSPLETIADFTYNSLVGLFDRRPWRRTRARMGRLRSECRYGRW